MEETLRHRALSPALGVEVLGLDLRAPLSPAWQAELRRLFDLHSLLLFRGQTLDTEDQIRVLSTFGPVSDEKSDGTRHSFVSNVRTDGLFGEANLTFHADYEFRPDPPPVLSLYGFEVSGASVPTVYASLAHAYRTLDPALRARFAASRSVYADDYTRKMDSPAYGKRYSLIALLTMPPDTTHPRTEHPLFRPHPRTGTPLLFVSEMHSSHIEGLDPEENERMLQKLFAHLYSPQNLYEHHWRQGDLVIWDNIGLQHGRPVNTGEMKQTRRTLRRVVVSDKTAAQLLGPYYNRPGSFEAQRTA